MCAHHAHEHGSRLYRYPWLSYHLLKGVYDKPAEKAFVLEESPLFRMYRAIMGPFFRSPGLRKALIMTVVLLLGFAGWLVLSRRVPLKMLPFDNKNELQVVIDMPRGTSWRPPPGSPTLWPITWSGFLKSPM